MPAAGGRTALEAVVGEPAAYEAPPPTDSPTAPLPADEASTLAGTEPSTTSAPQVDNVVWLEPPVHPPLGRPPPLAPSLPRLVPARPRPPDAGGQAARVRQLGERLEAARPPRPWGDFTDALRLGAWPERCAAACSLWWPHGGFEGAATTGDGRHVEGPA